MMWCVDSRFVLCSPEANAPGWHDNDVVGEVFLDDMVGGPLLRDGVIKDMAVETALYDTFEANDEVLAETRLSRTGRWPISRR